MVGPLIPIKRDNKEEEKFTCLNDDSRRGTKWA